MSHSFDFPTATTSLLHSWVTHLTSPLYQGVTASLISLPHYHHITALLMSHSFDFPTATTLPHHSWVTHLTSSLPPHHCITKTTHELLFWLSHCHHITHESLIWLPHHHHITTLLCHSWVNHLISPLPLYHITHESLFWLPYCHHITVSLISHSFDFPTATTSPMSHSFDFSTATASLSDSFDFPTATSLHQSWVTHLTSPLPPHHHATHELLIWLPHCHHITA